MILQIKNLSKQYGDQYALKNINLQLSEGIYGLLGPNGAGKSTLMNILTGNLKPTEGQVLLNDQEYLKEQRQEFRIGYMPQQQTLYLSYTGWRFLEYIGVLKGMKKTELQKQIPAVLEKVGLTEKQNDRIRTYSGGMRQRLLFAQAILGDPDLLILDEPTAGLDPWQRVQMQNVVRKIAKGKIILISTHVLQDIEELADELILLDHGTIVWRGKTDDPEQIYSHYFGKGKWQD